MPRAKCRQRVVKVAPSDEPRTWRLNYYEVSEFDPTNRHTNSDHQLARHALVDFDDIAVLNIFRREQLVDDLVKAVRFARTGVKKRKRGVSDKHLTNLIFFHDIARALERAGLDVKRWRKKYDNGGPESLFFKFISEVGSVFGIRVPKDLMRGTQKAAGLEYGAAWPELLETQETYLKLNEKRQHLVEIVKENYGLFPAPPDLS